MTPTSTLLKAIAVNWLRYKKHCPVVFTERPLGYTHCVHGTADVMALTKDRRLIEVETKISLSDFKKDIKKKKWQWQKYSEGGVWDCYLPSQFYYMVPPELVEKVKPLVDDNKGLITYFEADINTYTKLPEIDVVKPCKVTKRERMPVKYMIEVIKHQSGTICSLLSKLAKQEQI